MRKWVSFALVAIALPGFALTASAVPIDEFTTVQDVFVNPGPPTPQTVPDGVAAVEAIREARDVILSRTSGFGIAFADSSLSNDGLFSLSTGANTIALSTIVYDGTADGIVDPGGLGGVSVISGGESILRIYARSDLDTTIRVQLHSGSASDYLYTEIEIPGSGVGTGPLLPFDRPLASFLAQGAGADPGSLGAIQVFLNSEDGQQGVATSVDMQIDSILTIVPEPVSLVLMGLGLGGLSLVGRRQRA